MRSGHQVRPAPARDRPGAIVRSARLAAGLTLAELGERTGYSAAQISRLERGLASLADVSVLRLFATALAIPPPVFGLTPQHQRHPVTAASAVAPTSPPAGAGQAGPGDGEYYARCRQVWANLAVPAAFGSPVPGSPAAAAGRASPAKLLAAGGPDAMMGVRPLPAVGSPPDHLDGSPETVTPYADRGLITRQQWNGIIQGAISHLWLYGMAEFGYASDDEVPGILSAAAGKGCQTRILLLNPDYPGTAAIDADEGSPPGTLATRTQAALARFRHMQQACRDQVQIRIYNAHPTVSLVRGDDRMLVTPYLRFFLGRNSPTFELRSDAAGKMFSRYERHFEDTWNRAEDWT
jgi:Helix-turn-helix domain/Domain of unknown function (DUF5919)